MSIPYLPPIETKKAKLARDKVLVSKPNTAYWFSGTITSIYISATPIIEIACANGLTLRARMLPRLKDLFIKAPPSTYLGKLVVGKYLSKDAVYAQEMATPSVADYALLTLLQFIDRQECKAYQVEEWFTGETNPRTLPAIDYTKLNFCDHAKIRVQERDIQVSDKQMHYISEAIKDAVLKGKARISIAVDKGFILIVGSYGAILITALPYTQELVDETQSKRAQYLYIVDTTKGEDDACDNANG